MNLFSKKTLLTLFVVLLASIMYTLLNQFLSTIFGEHMALNIFIFGLVFFASIRLESSLYQKTK
jgi:hypothetical protein